MALPSDVARLAVAQTRLGHYSGDFWRKLETAGLKGLPAKELSDVVYAAAKLPIKCGAPRPGGMTA